MQIIFRNSMTKTSDQKSVVTTVDLIVKAIQEKKGTNISIIDLRNVMNASTDFFIICTGSSETNVQAISRSVEEILFETLNDKPLHVEGYLLANWILMDYFNTVVHIFKEEERLHYNLENLWADAEINNLTDKE